MENIIVLDTETSKPEAGDYRFAQDTNLVFDIGFTVIDEDTYEIKHRYNALVEEIYTDHEIMHNFFFGDEALQWYEKQVQEGAIPVKPAAQITKEVQEIVKKYDVMIITAYNATFDVEAIKDTWRDLHAGEIFNFDDMIVWDIYHMACQALEHDDNYTIAAVENGFVTNKGNIQATAEAVYSYIKKDPNFVEDHTALSDAEIESEILAWLLEIEKKNNMSVYFDREPNQGAWRLVQK